MQQALNHSFSKKKRAYIDINLKIAFTLFLKTVTLVKVVSLIRNHPLFKILKRV